MNEVFSARFDNSYARLPARFYARLDPEPVAAPDLVRVNHALARQLGLEPQQLESDTGVAILAGNRIPDGAEPLAMAYAGHQFGGWVPQLGDGRAILLGEILDVDGSRYDIQLKGSGRTPYSRGGDGRSPLGPVLREYIVSEAMTALGIPSTRSLAAVCTGERVFREQALPGAVLTRVARSHIRVGTFQFFAARQDHDALRLLVDYVLSRHFPDAGEDDNPALSLLRRVISGQAELLAQWQAIGFIHGVMNTDNTLLSGETIDYGPCAFLDEYDPDTVFSSIDHMGRYRYVNQPGIAHWNLTCLAQTLLPLLADNEELALAMAQEAVDGFPALYETAYRARMLRKLGLDEFREGDDALILDLLRTMASAKADFTLTFRRLTDLVCESSEAASSASAHHTLADAFEPWLLRWRQRLNAEPDSEAARQRRMYAVNPVFIPRNHRVEQAIDAAVQDADFAAFHRLVEVLEEPYRYRSNHADLALPPREEQRVLQTFCGT